MNKTPIGLKPALGFVAWGMFHSLPATTTEIVVRPAPYVHSTVSSKTVSSRTSCKYCGSVIFYDRKYSWNVYDHEWEEVTKEVPEVCKKCEAKDRAQKKLDAEERKLDRDIEYQKTRGRIDAKKRKLERLRNQNR